MSSERCLFVWDDAFAAYQFGPNHPLNPRRLTLTRGLIRALGLLDNDRVAVAAVEPAGDDDIALAHDAAYIEAVRHASAGLAVPERFGLGSEDVPIVPGMHRAAAHIVGATLTAARHVMRGEATRAFNIAGGLHHARRARAAGFCVYNDLAIAIQWMRREHGARVLYFDIDAHHGDGVQWIFYDDPDVLTVSFHESGTYLYPGTGFSDEVGSGAGFGYALNVPFDAHTTDASYLAAFDALMPDLADWFRPDVIVMQCGCDAHVLDPLTHMRCTTGLYETIVARTVALAERHCDGRMVATGGGGYAIYKVVPRAWTLVWAALCRTREPDDIPEDWRATVERESGVRPPATLRDAPDAFPPSLRADAVLAANARTIEDVRKRLAKIMKHGA